MKIGGNEEAEKRMPSQSIFSVFLFPNFYENEPARRSVSCLSCAVSLSFLSIGLCHKQERVP